MGARTFTRCTLMVADADYDLALAALLDVASAGWKEERTCAQSGGEVVRFTFWLDSSGAGAAAATAPSAAATGSRVATTGSSPAAGVPSAGWPVASRPTDPLDRLRRIGDVECAPQADDWADGWKRFHRPVTVGGVSVRAPWHEAAERSLEVVIDVGMAFGTGAHPTTRGCIAALAALVPGGSLVDLGTGSGVLALAALRLGYAPVWALDDDPEAVSAARDNAHRNGLQLDVTLADCLDPDVKLPDADVIVANLLLEPIVGLGERLTRAAAAEARRAGAGALRPRAIVLSGLLGEQVAAAEAAFRDYRRRDLAIDGEWATLVLEADRR